MRRSSIVSLLLVALVAAGGCSSESAMDPADAAPSRAFGIWHPSATESCTQEQHDAYSVVGQDGKRYPTWHPPTGPGGCSFGHEHGRDPRGSRLYDDAGGLPFGLANEALAISDPANPRDEDHVGHKVEWENDDGGGFRAIPDRTCVDQFLLVPPGQQSNYSALHETWETSNSVRRADGHTLAFFNPYFQVRLPSRFYDPALAPVVGRPIAVCYELTPDGRRASGGACDASTSGGLVTGLTFDSVGSAFNGAGHFVDVNANQLSNGAGPEVWYSDAFGRNGQTEPFEGSIRQRLAKMDNNIGVDAGGPVIGNNRNYAGPGVHAPN